MDHMFQDTSIWCAVSHIQVFFITIQFVNTQCHTPNVIKVFFMKICDCVNYLRYEIAAFYRLVLIMLGIARSDFSVHASKN